MIHIFLKSASLKVNTKHSAEFFGGAANSFFTFRKMYWLFYTLNNTYEYVAVGKHCLVRLQIKIKINIFPSISYHSLRGDLIYTKKLLHLYDERISFLQFKYFTQLHYIKANKM